MLELNDIITHLLRVRKTEKSMPNWCFVVAKMKFQQNDVVLELNETDRARNAIETNKSD